MGEGKRRRERSLGKKNVYKSWQKQQMHSNLAKTQLSTMNVPALNTSCELGLFLATSVNGSSEQIQERRYYIFPPAPLDLYSLMPGAGCLRRIMVGSAPCCANKCSTENKPPPCTSLHYIMKNYGNGSRVLKNILSKKTFTNSRQRQRTSPNINTRMTLSS